MAKRLVAILIGFLATTGIVTAANQIGMPVSPTGKPSCDAAHRGLTWLTPGIDAGVADVVERCQKDADGVFAWVDITNPGAVVGGDGGVTLQTNRTATDGDDLLVYTFDQAAGTTVSNTGVVDGGNLTADDSAMLGHGGGMFDRRLRVNADNYVSAGGESVGTDAGTSVSLSTWFMPTSTTIAEYGNIVKKTWTPANNTAPYVSFGMQYSNTTSATGVWSCLVATSETTRCLDASGFSSITPYDWNHVGCTYDGTNLRLYLNGRLVATGLYNWSGASCGNSAGTGGNVDWGTGPWIIGGTPGETSQWVNGYFDDVRFAGVLRDEAWFTGVYKKGVGRQ